MRRALSLCLAALGAATLLACDAGASPSTSAQHEVDQAVRRYIDARNQGDLQGLLSLSCEDLYISARNLLHLPEERRSAVIIAMRQHPADVDNVTVEHAEDFHFDVTLVASAHTPQGRQTGTQHVAVREYQDGYRICKMNP